MWVTVLACASPDPADPAGDPAPLAPDEVSAALTADEGGALALDGGGTLTVPPGALAADATVTLARRSCTGVFGPDWFDGCLYGIDATAPWRDRFALALPRSPADARAVRDAIDGLRPLAVDADDADVLSGASSGVFALRLLAASPADGRCTEPDFAPCGGELAGRWALTAACGTTAQVTGVSWHGRDRHDACDPLDVWIDTPFTAEGTLAFAADGTWEETREHAIVQHEVVAVACLDVLAEPCNAQVCVDVDGVCDCTWTKSSAVSASGGGAWAPGTEPGTVALDGAVARYCVDGDTLAFEHPHPDGAWVAYYTRAP